MRIVTFTDLNGKAIHLLPQNQVGFAQVVVPRESEYNPQDHAVYATVITGISGDGSPGGNKVLVRDLADEVKWEINRALRGGEELEWTEAPFRAATDAESADASAHWRKAQEARRQHEAAQSLYLAGAAPVGPRPVHH